PNPAAAADAEIPNRAAIIAAPPVSAAGAIVRAAENIGDKLVEPAVRSLGPPDGGVQKFSAGRLPGTVQARLVWLPMAAARLQLCWEVQIKGQTHAELFRVLVDARTGEVWLRRSLTAYGLP